MENKIHIAVVNFKTVWGNKNENLKAIEEYCYKAYKKGVEMIVFPETALTGYTNETNKEFKDKMHVRLAETIPGYSTGIIAELAKKYQMYIIFGMPERDVEDEFVVYNSAAIIHPNGKIESYRKIHLPFDEKEWATEGNQPLVIDTKWGPVGISICYDTYCFPELLRYYRAKGTRLILNVTACPDISCTRGSAILSIPAYAFINYVFIASANLVGQEKQNNFMGGSGVIGPAIGECKTYVGHMFGDENSNFQEMLDGIVDLSLADKNAEIPIFRFDENNKRDWKKELYKKMLEDC